MAPSTTKQWTVIGKDGFDKLRFDEKVELPTLGDHDVLVNFHYVSLNYRDLIIPQVGVLGGSPSKSELTSQRENIHFPLVFPGCPHLMAQELSLQLGLASHVSKRAMPS